MTLKMNFISKLKLNSQMAVIIGLMALLQTSVIGFYAIHNSQKSLNEQMGQRALFVAKTIAAMPSVIHAIKIQDTAFLQTLSLKLADENQSRFVVIGDKEGKRLAHPNVKKIGHYMKDDEGDDNAEALIRGQGYVSKAEGSLGWTMRGKVPVYDINSNNIVGIISVGYSLEQVDKTIAQYRIALMLVIISSFIIGIGIAVAFANHFKRAIFGLEPRQIARLFNEQKATLESVREGIIAINNKGEITTANRAAVNTLGLTEKSNLKGLSIHEVLDDKSILNVLKDGKPQYDQEVRNNGHDLIVNRLPLKQGNLITGVVSSFRRKDELDLVSQKLTRIQQYADSLHSQSHEYSNKLHTIAGLIQIGAHEQALELIGQENHDQQSFIETLIKSVPDKVLAGCLLGKFNKAKELGLQFILDEESELSELPEYIPKENLVSILGNLIDNAFEATLKSKTNRGKVTLSMTDIGNDLIFEVEDHGIGIPEDMETKIFEKGISSKNKDGHGIGLHLVKDLLDNLGGTITLSPKPSPGSLFTVYIPKIKAKEHYE